MEKHILIFQDMITVIYSSIKMDEIETRDAIHAHEELITKEVCISGDVDEQSIIDAHKLVVEGTTHEDSTQFSKYAEIYMHQGTLRCHEAKVTLLDGGEIHATSVSVDTAIGGSIYAQDVTIKHLTSNIKIYASHSISIEHISGANNLLSINYKNVPILVSKIDLIHDDIDDLEISLQKAKKDNSTLQIKIQEEIDRLNKEILQIKNSANSAKITIQKPISTKNTINFELDNTQSVYYETTKQKYTPFYIETTDNTIILHPTQK